MSSTAPQPEQREAAFFTAIRGWGITRGRNRVLGGVAQGVGERIGLARVPARLILVVAGLVLSGIILVAYAAAWALLPDREGNIIIQNFGRGVTNVGALIGIAIFGLIGAFNLEPGFGGSGPIFGWTSKEFDGFGRYDHVLAVLVSLLALGFSLLVIGGIVFAIVYSIRRSKQNGPPRSGPYAVPPARGREPAGSAGETTPTNPLDPVAVPEGTESAGDETVAVPEGTPAPPAAAVPGQPQPWEAAVVPGNASTTGATTASAAWNGTHRASVPPVPPVPPRPPVRRVPGPGRRFYLITAAWLVISIAIIMVTNRVDGLAVAPGLAWLALFIVGFGLILVAIAVSGRKLGFLGFLSVPLLIAGLLVAVNSGELRNAYDSATDAINPPNDGSLVPSYAPPDDPTFEDPTLADPTLTFADDYQQVYLAPQCYAWDAMQPDEWAYSGGFSGEGSDGSSRARLTYPELTANTTVDITAARTMLTIPEGTNLILRADSNAQSSIDWESRGLYCEFWDGDQDNMTLVNPGAPTLTLLVHDDMNANTIEIHEVPTVQTPSTQATASPQPTASPEPTSATDATNPTNEEVQS